MRPEIPWGQRLACRVIWLEVLLLGYMVPEHFASIMLPSRLGSSPSQGKSTDRPGFPLFVRKLLACATPQSQLTSRLQQIFQISFTNLRRYYQGTRFLGANNCFRHTQFLKLTSVSLSVFSPKPWEKKPHDRENLRHSFSIFTNAIGASKLNGPGSTP